LSHLSDLLGKRPPVVNVMGPSDPVAEAVRCMAERRVGAVLVVEDRQLVGIFSERDVLRRVLAARRDPEQTALEDVMTRDPVTSTPEESSSRAIAKMRVAGCRHLPILQGGQIVDTISIRDLLFRELADRDGDIEELRRYIHGQERGPGFGEG
jgi:CBS domain-containing protein